MGQLQALRRSILASETTSTVLGSASVRSAFRALATELAFFSCALFPSAYEAPVVAHAASSRELFRTNQLARLFDAMGAVTYVLPLLSCAVFFRNGGAASILQTASALWSGFTVHLFAVGVVPVEFALFPSTLFLGEHEAAKAA